VFGDDGEVNASLRLEIANLTPADLLACVPNQVRRRRSDSAVIGKSFGIVQLVEIFLFIRF